MHDPLFRYNRESVTSRALGFFWEALSEITHEGQAMPLRRELHTCILGQPALYGHEGVPTVIVESSLALTISPVLAK
jgi:hypothetical protein